MPRPGVLAAWAWQRSLPIRNHGSLIDFTIMKLKLPFLALCLLAGGTGLQAQTNGDPVNPADALVISTAQPLAATATNLRQTVFQRCREMLDAPAGKFGAQPSAAIFPGAVAPGTPRISSTVHLQHVPPDAAMLRLITPLDYSDPFAPTLYSTALYAAPGEVVSVVIPERSWVSWRCKSAATPTT